MSFPSSLRGCCSCLPRRVQQLHQQQSRQSTFALKGSFPTTTSLWRPRPRVKSTHSKSRGLPPDHQHSKLPRARTIQHRNATMATTKSVVQQSQRNARKEMTEVLSAIMGQPRTIPIPRWVSPKHHSITLSECCGHASFILVAFSYAVDDFLWLRIIAVAGSTSMLFFTYFHPHGRVLWLPFKWNCLFIAINSYRIGLIYWHRYLAEQLSDEMREARIKHFYLMDPVDFAHLARAGHVESFQKGDVIQEQNQPNFNVRVVLSGDLRVLRNGKLTYTLEEGNFISECGLHAGLMLPDSVESCCQVVADSEARLLTWDRTELIELLERKPHLRRGMKAVLSWDIVRKLKGQRLLLSSGLIADEEAHAWTDRRNEQTEHRYTAILKNILSHDPDYMKKRKKELNKYRVIHHIDDEHHRGALKECGWTVEEYEQGHKNDATPEQPFAFKKPQHGPDWYVKQAIMRIMG